MAVRAARMRTAVGTRPSATPPSLLDACAAKSLAQASAVLSGVDVTGAQRARIGPLSLEELVCSLYTDSSIGRAATNTNRATSSIILVLPCPRPPASLIAAAQRASHHDQQL